MVALLKKMNTSIAYGFILFILLLQVGCVSPIDEHFDATVHAIHQEVATVKAQQQARIKAQAKDRQPAPQRAPRRGGRRRRARAAAGARVRLRRCRAAGGACARHGPAGPRRRRGGG